MKLGSVMLILILFWFDELMYFCKVPGRDWQGSEEYGAEAGRRAGAVRERGGCTGWGGRRRGSSGNR